MKITSRLRVLITTGAKRAAATVATRVHEIRRQMGGASGKLEKGKGE